MRIKYDMNSDYFNIFNEAMGILRARNEIKKKENFKLRKYLSHYYKSFILYGLFIVVALINIFAFKRDVMVWVILLIVFSIILIALIFILVKQFKGILNLDHSGVVQVDKEGLLDYSKTSKAFWKWDMIDYAVIGDYSVTFVLKHYPYIFALSVAFEKELFKEIKKYNKDLIIFDKRNKVS